MPLCKFIYLYVFICVKAFLAGSPRKLYSAFKENSNEWNYKRKECKLSTPLSHQKQKNTKKKKSITTAKTKQNINNSDNEGITLQEHDLKWMK